MASSANDFRFFDSKMMYNIGLDHQYAAPFSPKESKSKGEIAAVADGLVKWISLLREQLEGTDQRWKVENHLLGMETLVHKLYHIKIFE